jgi:hypothetical protein
MKKKKKKKKRGRKCHQSSKVAGFIDASGPIYLWQVKRGEQILSMAQKIDCAKFVSPADIANGAEQLNVAFVAHLFSHLQHFVLQKKKKEKEKIK